MKQNPRDHTKLICDIGELSGIFADASSLDAFLQKIVEMISEHMRSQVCSIYLYYEDKGELVLKATKGLNPESIGKVKMKLGEGLTGLALKELRPICERNARSSPNFKYFPGIGEEAYESFMVVPIVRGQTRIGAMVLQNSQRNCFTEEDIKVFRAVTSQLANTIETAKLLMSLNEKHEPYQNIAAVRELKFIKGLVASSGFALAEAVVMGRDLFSEILAQPEFERSYTLDDFIRAVAHTEKQLESLQKQIEEQLSDVASLIFTAQILMLKDKGFIDSIIDLIKDDVNPPQAIVSVVANYVKMFDQVTSSYLREKKQDVKDIGTRLLENLMGACSNLSHYEGNIVIAQELFPSDALKLSSQKIAGLILLSGGVSSHLSILARSLSIPLIIADTPALLDLAPQTRVLLDAEQGNIYINPTREMIATFKEKEELREELDKLKKTMLPVTKTKDGTLVKLLANINLLGDLKAACEFKAEGIGLYRSEFPFIVRSDFPSEEEQFVIYKKLVDGMKGKEITFRTLDIGGDKVLSYYNFSKEENPFLGMRSIRFSLKHQDIFTQQIRAIMRAGLGADIRIMFPMISSLDEFLEAKSIVSECSRSLAKEKIPHHRNPSLGLMVELPAVVEIIEELAQEADFFCIGTNDYIQYMLAVDRTNEKVADLYLPHHPAVLRSLKKVVDAALREKIDVSICGDMADDEKYLQYFLGIGIRKFSLNSRYLPRVQAAIGRINLKDAQKVTQKLLTNSKVSKTSEIINGRG